MVRRQLSRGWNSDTDRDLGDLLSAANRPWNASYARVAERPALRSRAVPKPQHQTLCGSNAMLETIAIILLLLWIFGMVSSYTVGGLIHILLVVAIVIFLLRVIRGRRVV